MAGDTDGTDGGRGLPHDPAGAFLDDTTLVGPARSASIPPRFSPTTNTTGFFNGIGDLFTPGPTFTNVTDFRAFSLTKQRLDAKSEPQMRQASPLKAVAGMLLVAAIAVVALTASARPAAADFRLCNNTASRVGNRRGLQGRRWLDDGGWRNVSARSCETVLKGNLVARYYYVYAIDYDRGGEWMGQAYMCTRDKEFTILAVSVIVSRAVMTAPAFSRSIPGSSAPGRCN